jgi:hypothetical protein
LSVAGNYAKRFDRGRVEMSWILTDLNRVTFNFAKKYLHEHGRSPETTDYFPVMLKAEARFIYDRLQEPCKEHPLTSTQQVNPHQHGSTKWINGRPYWAKRLFCPECMAEFKAELEGK